MTVATRLAVLAAALAALAPASTPMPPVVSTSWLAERLDGPGVVVVDARPSLRDYLTRHVPGALFLTTENLRSGEGGVPAQILPYRTVVEILARVGLDPRSRIVVYGAETDPDAAFLATILRLHGFPEVAVLDGGFNRWIAEKRPESAEGRRIPHASVPTRFESAALASLEDVRKASATRSAVLVDARPPEQHEAGRVPGSLSRFWKRDLGPDGMLKSRETLDVEYRALGVTPGKPVIVYCNTGHQAASVFFALRYVLGREDVRLYDGSWVEWSIDPAASRESGPPTGAGPALEKARGVADALTGSLQATLLSELAKGGSVAAVKVCSEVAPGIAAQHSVGGASVRRVSLKPRNPADTPDPYETGRLKDLEALQRSGKLPAETSEVVVEGGARTLRYLRPISVAGPCLACHGDPAAIDPEVRKTIRERYPKDAATGYAVGDLRGAVSVTAPLD